MNSAAKRLGFLAAMAATISFLCFTACFLLIALTKDPQPWTDLDTYMESFRHSSPSLKHIAQVCVIVFAMSYVVIIHSLAEGVAPSKRIYAQLSIAFAIIFATLAGITYFVQITAVRFHITQGARDGLAGWIMFNPLSYGLAIAMLGWTFMLGFSSIFASMLFEGTGLSRAIRILFIMNAIFCLAGGIAYIFQHADMVGITLNLGMGGTLTLLSLLLVFYFRREIPQE